MLGKSNDKFTARPHVYLYADGLETALWLYIIFATARRSGKILYVRVYIKMEWVILTDFASFYCLYHSGGLFCRFNLPRIRPVYFTQAYLQLNTLILLLFNLVLLLPSSIFSIVTNPSKSFSWHACYIYSPSPHNFHKLTRNEALRTTSFGTPLRCSCVWCGRSVWQRPVLPIPWPSRRRPWWQGNLHRSPSWYPQRRGLLCLSACGVTERTWPYPESPLFL